MVRRSARVFAGFWIFGSQPLHLGQGILDMGVGAGGGGCWQRFNLFCWAQPPWQRPNLDDELPMNGRYGGGIFSYHPQLQFPNWIKKMGVSQQPGNQFAPLLQHGSHRPRTAGSWKHMGWRSVFWESEPQMAFPLTLPKTRSQPVARSGGKGALMDSVLGLTC